MHNNSNIAFHVREYGLIKYVSIWLTRSVGHRVGIQIFCLYLLSGQRWHGIHRTVYFSNYSFSLLSSFRLSPRWQQFFTIGLFILLILMLSCFHGNPVKPSALVFGEGKFRCLSLLEEHRLVDNLWHLVSN